MHKKTLIILFIVLLLIPLISIPLVSATIYNSLPTEVGEIYAGNSVGVDPGNGGIWSVGAYLFSSYAVGGFNVDHYWGVSSNNGTTWAASSSGMRTAQSGTADYCMQQWDGVYDPTTGNFHAAYTFDGTSTNDALKYAHGSRSGSTISNTVQTWINNAGGGGAAAVTVDENGYPIIAYAFYNVTDSPFSRELCVGFGDSTGSSPNFSFYWANLTDIFGIGNEYSSLDLHVVDSNNVLVLFGQLAGTYTLRGVYVHRSTGIGSGFVVSQDSLTGDVRDVNNNYFGTWDSYSEHTEDPRNFAEELLICYFNNAGEMKGELYDIDLGGGDVDLQSGQEKTIEDISSSYTDPCRVGISKDLDSYFVMYQYERDDFAPEFSNYSWAERSWSSGDWSVTQPFFETNSDQTSFYISDSFIEINGTKGVGINFMDSTQDFFFYEDEGSLSPLDLSISIDGENFNTNQGEPDFVFVDWKYYQFNLTIPDAQLNSTDVDFAFLRFNIPTYEGMIQVAPYYDNISDVWGLITNVSDPNRAGQPVLLQDGSSSSWSTAGQTGTSFFFSIWFEDKCADVFDPLDCIDVEVAWNETDGYAHSWVNTQDVFRIYNDGGFADDVVITGNAGVLPGGRDLSMFGYNESYVYKELVWRDSVHIKIMPTVYFRAGYSTWDQYYSFDYVFANGTQRQGLQLLIEPSFVSYTGVFASNVWINMTCSWYDRNGLIKQDVLYMFYHGTVFNTGDSGRWKFWVDFWFDNTNGSTVQGGRINAYEYPVEDNSAAWVRWLSSNWGVKDNVTKQSECFTTIYDDDGTTPINSESIKFVVFSSTLDVPGILNSDQYVAIADFGVYDITLAQQLPMKGINAPPWDETQQPVVGNSGLIGALFSMFSGIGGWLSENILFGGLNLWGNFVAFLDTIAGWLGAPGFFSWLFNEIAAGLTYLYSSALYVVDIIADVFSIFAELLLVFVGVVSDLIGNFINTLQTFVDIMGGVYGEGVNVWETLGITTWITVGMIFYPLYLVILWEQKGLDAVIQQLTWIFGTLVWLYEFLSGVIQSVINLIVSLVESIPVAE